VLDRPGGRVLGVVTLHDLLRAEAAMSEAGSG
jgi:CBS domain-containing protein